MELHGLSWMAIISQTARGTLPQNLNIMTNLAQRIDTFLQLEVTMKLAETVSREYALLCRPHSMSVC